jgi:hypothetical protein
MLDQTRSNYSSRAYQPGKEACISPMLLQPLAICATRSTGARIDCLTRLQLLVLERFWTCTPSLQTPRGERKYHRMPERVGHECHWRARPNNPDAVESECRYEAEIFLTRSVALFHRPGLRTPVAARQKWWRGGNELRLAACARKQLGPSSIPVIHSLVPRQTLGPIHECSVGRPTSLAEIRCT